MQRRRFILAALATLPPLGLAAASGPASWLSSALAGEAREPILGLPCEGCEAVFDGIPAAIPAPARIAPAGEPGAPLALAGRVVDQDGRPQPGIIVYAYHTDRNGIYPASNAAATRYGRRHGRLRGWARTDADGRYAFDSIRPGSYPGADIPEHIHMHVIEPGCGTYYIDDVMFRDDPKLTRDQERKLSPGRGGHGIVAPSRRDGVWQVRRDIVLGLGIPDYPQCTRS